MKYLQQSLHINEEVLILPKLHWAVYFDNYFSLAVLYVMLCESMNFFIENSHQFYRFFETTEKYIGLAIFLRIVYLFIRNYSIEMAVTNYRVIFKIGIIHIYSEELSNDKVETVCVMQSFVGRLLNYGNIVFSGTGTSKLVFRKVYAPWWVKSKIEDLMRQIAIKRHDQFGHVHNVASQLNNMNHPAYYNKMAYQNQHYQDQPYPEQAYNNHPYHDDSYNRQPYRDDNYNYQQYHDDNYNTPPYDNQAYGRRPYNNAPYPNDAYENDSYEDNSYDPRRNPPRRY